MKRFGFGCMRLPMQDGQVDYPQFERMIDRFLQAGFCYFDTAHGYLSGKSETAIRDCLVKRYPRQAFLLTDKLTQDYFQTEQEILPFFEEQLRATGVTYFDYYLLHAIKEDYYEKFVRCKAFQIAQQLKEQGKIKHFGISFHDTPALLDRILTEHPEIEVVQIQLNYEDYDAPGIESDACYQVCRRHHKPVIVMEPIKGGGLVNLPDEAKRIWDACGHASYASYALRYYASYPDVFMILSGMSTFDNSCFQ